MPDERKGYADSAVAPSMGRRAGPPLHSPARGAAGHLRRAGGSPAHASRATQIADVAFRYGSQQNATARLSHS